MVAVLIPAAEENYSSHPPFLPPSLPHSLTRSLAHALTHSPSQVTQSLSHCLQVVDALIPAADEIVLPKTSSSVFNSTCLDYLLRNMDKRFLLLAGCVTDQCVSHAVKDAADLGYLVTLVTGVCCARCAYLCVLCLLWPSSWFVTSHAVKMQWT